MGVISSELVEGVDKVGVGKPGDTSSMLLAEGFDTDRNIGRAGFDDTADAVGRNNSVNTICFVDTLGRLV